jgi:serine/threonine protein kinase
MAGCAIGKFTVLGTLGKGAHSSILHIRCSRDGKQYALKVVPINSKEDLKFLEQAKHEFQVAQMLEHPNLIKIYALETPRDWLFRIRKVHLLIEYVNGKTLDIITGLTIARLVLIFTKVADGMVQMHRRGVYHADLKPSNIMLSKTGDVKVIDYGLAWIKGEKKGRVQGTPEYMAPEQARQGTVNERTDIYNFGATMYRLITFRHPPPAHQTTDGLPMDAKIFQSVLKPVEECNPQTPRDLAALIHRCMAFSPSQRPERMSEIQGILDRLSEELVVSDEDKLEAMEW